MLCLGTLLYKVFKKEYSVNIEKYIYMKKKLKIMLAFIYDYISASGHSSEQAFTLITEGMVSPL